MTAVADDLRQHLKHVARALVKGQVVPVLGAGANLCDRGAEERWVPGSNLPDGSELARWLADELEVEVANTADLLTVSQYAEVVLGTAPLYNELHRLFGRGTYPVTSLHRFLAGLPARLEERGLPRRHQLIVTTNYDELMERALREAVGSFDVVRYLTSGQGKGHFIHEPNEAPDANADKGPFLIDRPRDYDRISPEIRTVVLKVHGGLCQHDADDDSYVITEDDYIDYLMNTSPNELIPARLLATLSNSHLLFLGYGMHDWNLRVLLQHISNSRDLKWNWWAIQLKVGAFDREMWMRRDVALHQVRLSDYVKELEECVEQAMDRAVKDLELDRGGDVHS
jgi:hypothetical protein